MNNIVFKNKFLILRRFTQSGIIFLFLGSNLLGWKILTGNLSSAKFLNYIPLTDPYAVLQTFATGTILAADALVGALFIWVFYTVFAGRMFCSYVCPMNIVTDTALFLRRKLNLQKESLRINVSRNTRYYVLALSFVLSAIFGVAAFELASPVGMFQRGLLLAAGAGWGAALVIFLFDLAVLQNGWCGHICPIGAFYTLSNRISLLKVTHTKSNCTACNKCFVACPEKEVLTPVINKTDGQIQGGACTNCARCIEVCDDNALKFSINHFKKIKNQEYV